jgi:hypothetical protein
MSLPTEQESAQKWLRLGTRPFGGLNGIYERKVDERYLARLELWPVAFPDELRSKNVKVMRRDAHLKTPLGALVCNFVNWDYKSPEHLVATIRDGAPRRRRGKDVGVDVKVLDVLCAFIDAETATFGGVDWELHEISGESCH